jgi:hypothetical protein
VVIREGRVAGAVEGAVNSAPEWGWELSTEAAFPRRIFGVLATLRASRKGYFKVVKPNLRRVRLSCEGSCGIDMRSV